MTTQTEQIVLPPGATSIRVPLWPPLSVGMLDLWSDPVASVTVEECGSRSCRLPHTVEKEHRGGKCYGHHFSPFGKLLLTPGIHQVGDYTVEVVRDHS